MSVSEKIRASIEKSSWIRKMFEEGGKRKAKYGAENVFDFSLGNPNLEPPPRFNQILQELISDPASGQHAYMPNAGFVETRQAVADYLNKFNMPEFKPDEIVMTVGAGGALNVVLKTVLNPGEEVIIPKPYFVEYNFYLDNHQAVPKLVSTKPDFSLDCDAISEAMTEKTRAILIDSPNNPTGNVYGEEELKELAGVLSHFSEKFGQPIYLISDEPYRRITYDGVTVPSIFNVYNESFVVTSFSKDLSLPGERIGYAAAHPDISDKGMISAGMVLCNRVLGYVNAPALMQRAVSHLLEESVDISIYQKRRDMLCDGLASFGYDFVKPQGAFYLFPKTPVEDDVAFVGALQEENILTVPGTGFGGPGHFRIAYCVSDETIEKALPGFERVMKKY
ncbi:MAG: pyridoxal phosphate-dependent aminotransferase [Deltaproteobacteria bacterium]|nr:pyridoxal phosphate-dependent aminotransferase [Deltaproteobacteria bacterium]MBW2116349.1 pyridoxal phosphate-dependent aminotransferase [Deltaproteobacteria bacterium]MBW2342432.1 pyridoxal phosphate-dependent aminotransferase [Deltaproteobacteria bacterium]